MEAAKNHDEEGVVRPGQKEGSLDCARDDMSFRIFLLKRLDKYGKKLLFLNAFNVEMS